METIGPVLPRGVSAGGERNATAYRADNSGHLTRIRSIAPSSSSHRPLTSSPIEPVSHDYAVELVVKVEAESLAAADQIPVPGAVRSDRRGPLVGTEVAEAMGEVVAVAGSEVGEAVGVGGSGEAVTGSGVVSDEPAQASASSEPKSAVRMKSLRTIDYRRWTFALHRPSRTQAAARALGGGGAAAEGGRAQPRVPGRCHHHRPP